MLRCFVVHFLTAEFRLICTFPRKRRFGQHAKRSETPYVVSYNDLRRTEYGRFFLAPNRAVVPKPSDEANRCNLRHVAPKTFQKALYVGVFASSRLLQVVYLGWSQFPVPEAPPPRVGLTNLRLTLSRSRRSGLSPCRLVLEFGPTALYPVHTHKLFRLFLEAGTNRPDIPNQRCQPLWIEIEAVGVREEVPKRFKAYPALMPLQTKFRLPGRLLPLSRFGVALQDSLGSRLHPVGEGLGTDDGGVCAPTEHPLLDLLEVV